MKPPLPAAPIPSIYQDAQHYDLLAQMTAPADLPFYLRQVEHQGGPVLELGCGTGRLCLPIAATGVETIGIDNAPALLDQARAKAEMAKLDVTLLAGDYRDFALQRSLALIILPYNAANHLLDLESIDACFAAARRHMTAESRFILDTFNPDPKSLAVDPQREDVILDYHDPHRQQRVVMTERNTYDPATQINRVTWRYQIGGQPDARVDEIDMRVFFPQELDGLLQHSGFTIERKLGDYTGRSFGSRSCKQLCVCRLNGRPSRG